MLNIGETKFITAKQLNALEQGCPTLRVHGAIYMAPTRAPEPYTLKWCTTVCTHWERLLIHIHLLLGSFIVDFHKNCLV